MTRRIPFVPSVLARPTDAPIVVETVDEDDVQALAGLPLETLRVFVAGGSRAAQALMARRAKGARS